MTENNPPDSDSHVNGVILAESTSVPSLRAPFLLLIFLVLIIFGSGFYVFHKLKQNETGKIKQNLAAIAQLKADQINGWIKQNKKNAEVIVSDPLAADRIGKWLKHGVLPGQNERWLHNYLKFIRKHYSYRELSLLDVKGKPRLSTDIILPDIPDQGALLHQAIVRKQPEIGVMHAEARPDGSTYMLLPMVLPLIPSGARSAVGALLVELDVNHFLFPLVQTWPAPSRTAETQIARREGDQIVFLSKLRDQKDADLLLRVPVDHPTLLMAQAARGTTGFISGVDNQGESVIGYAQKIPDTDWLMVAKIDSDEVYGPIHQLAFSMAIGAFLLLVVASLALFFWWRNRHAHYQAAQLQFELKQQLLSQRFDYLSKYANDIILLINEAGEIVEANERAETAYGLTRQELLGRRISRLRIPAEAAIAESQWKKVNERKTLLFESCHVRSDGSQFPVEINSRTIETEHGVFVQSIIRDITERKTSQEREHRLLNIYHALSATGEAILHEPNEPALFSALCRIAVQYGGMIHAWIGVPDIEGRFFQVASHGKIDDFVSEIIALAKLNMSKEQGLVGVSYRENRAVVINDIEKNVLTEPWRKNAGEYEVKAVSSYPILRGGEAYAVVVVYSDQVDAFDEEIVSLLGGMAVNISFALDNFDREHARRQTEEELKLAAMVYQDSSEGMIVSDGNDKILAVNPAFERMTGYHADEAVGNQTDMLRSGLHDEEVYHSIKQALNTTGYWKGELWNARKSGEVFATLTTINTISVEDGAVSRKIMLLNDITDKKRTEGLIWTQANFDSLTGLPNRRLFREHLQQEIRKARRAQKRFALMFLDLDGFKHVNDTLGHDVGDTLLKEAAHRLQSCMRTSDTIARLGGDEFTIIVSELNDLGSASRVARHVLKVLSEPFQLGKKVAYVSASIGITFYPEDATEIEDMIKNADQAMYAAKHAGKNRFHCFSLSMHEKATSRIQLVNELRSAMDGNQLKIAYQPIVDMASGTIQKAEAHICWEHPTRGLLNPVEFISAAEDMGMIIAFGNWIFHEAAKQASKWREKYHPAFQISVNIAPVQFKNQGVDSLAWIDHLKEFDLPGNGIAVEITEGLILDSSHKVMDQLVALRNAGIEVLLDDFGTGYSSLSYLKAFDIDYIKIDQSFIIDLKVDSDNLALCEAMIVMAHKLGIKVIAEGVETAVQRKLLVNAGCDYAQGYLFSGPVAAEELEKLLEIAPCSPRELQEF